MHTFILSTGPEEEYIRHKRQERGIQCCILRSDHPMKLIMTGPETLSGPSPPYQTMSRATYLCIAVALMAYMSAIAVPRNQPPSTSDMWCLLSVKRVTPTDQKKPNCKTNKTSAHAVDQRPAGPVGRDAGMMVQTSLVLSVGP